MVLLVREGNKFLLCVHNGKSFFLFLLFFHNTTFQSASLSLFVTSKVRPNPSYWMVLIDKINIGEIGKFWQTQGCLRATNLQYSYSRLKVKLHKL